MTFRPRRNLQKILNPVIRRWVFWYFRRQRKWTYKTHTFVINPGVFFPHFTHSTGILLSHLDTLDLSDRSVLDIGCGSGILSIYSAVKGARVTAIDISQSALDNTRINAERHKVSLKIFKSDLLESVPADEEFDIVLINPPYYPKEPESAAEFAWFCGSDFQYFSGLFKQLSERYNYLGTIYMILSEDCDIGNIQKIASHNQLEMELISEYKKAVETNFIFSVRECLTA